METPLQSRRASLFGLFAQQQSSPPRTRGQTELRRIILPRTRVNSVRALLGASLGGDDSERPEALLYIQRQAEGVDRGEGTKSLEVTWRRLDEVFDTLEQDLQRVDENLRRLTAAAAYLRALLPPRRRRGYQRRRGCTTARRTSRCRRR